MHQGQGPSAELVDVPADVVSTAVGVVGPPEGVGRGVGDGVAGAHDRVPRRLIRQHTRLGTLGLQ